MAANPGARDRASWASSAKLLFLLPAPGIPSKTLKGYEKVFQISGNSSWVVANDPAIFPARMENNIPKH